MKRNILCGWPDCLTHVKIDPKCILNVSSIKISTTTKEWPINLQVQQRRASGYLNRNSLVKRRSQDTPLFFLGHLVILLQHTEIRVKDFYISIHLGSWAKHIRIKSTQRNKAYSHIWCSTKIIQFCIWETPYVLSTRDWIFLLHCQRGWFDLDSDSPQFMVVVRILMSWLWLSYWVMRPFHCGSCGLSWH
jgi:hypothetical protein